MLVLAVLTAIITKPILSVLFTGSSSDIEYLINVKNKVLKDYSNFIGNVNKYDIVKQFHLEKMYGTHSSECNF